MPEGVSMHERAFIAAGTDAGVRMAGAPDREPVVRRTVTLETREMPIEIPLAFRRGAMLGTRPDVLVDAIRGTTLPPIAKADVVPVAHEAFAFGETRAAAETCEQQYGERRA